MAYESIRNPYRRKPAPTTNSDMDIWISLKDNKKSASVQHKVETRGSLLVEEIASGIITRGSFHWSTKKQVLFGPYYKNLDYYSDKFKDLNSKDYPWMAESFKDQFEKRLISRIPGFVERVNQHFNKKIPGGFLEIRAYPESLFTLRPDQVIMPNGVMDRMPFPFIGDQQFLSPNHTSFILYSTNKSTIYPLKENGRVLGTSMDEHIRHQENKKNTESYGGFFIKPDTIQREQLDIVMSKIKEGITRFNGEIVVEKPINKLTDSEVEELYPLVEGKELKDLKKYITSGEVVIIVIKAPLTEKELFKNLNAIKGPRIADRSLERLNEGRITNGAIRDLLPLPGDESSYQEILPRIINKKKDASLQLTDKQYKYYSRNLIHAPDNTIELSGLFKIAGFDEL